METYLLFYKKFERIDKPKNYVEWACRLLEKEEPSPSLFSLASLHEPYNIFEVYEYFERACKELKISTPTYEETIEAYVHHLLEEIVSGYGDVLHLAYEVYKIIREHFQDERVEVWYEFSELIDDVLYGDNMRRLTKEGLKVYIIEYAKAQIKKDDSA